MCLGKCFASKHMIYSVVTKLSNVASASESIQMNAEMAWTARRLETRASFIKHDYAQQLTLQVGSRLGTTVLSVTSALKTAKIVKVATPFSVPSNYGRPHLRR